MKLERKYDYADVLIVPNDSNITSRSEVELRREFKFKWSPIIHEGIGLIAANMDTVGTFEMAGALNEYGIFTAIHKHYSLGQISGWFDTESGARSFYTIGTSLTEFTRLEWYIKAHDGEKPELICIDIANGHSNILLDAVTRVRTLCPDSVIMAGNVVTGDRAVKVIEAGADVVKVGIGPGSACTTRKQTGVGYPQLSAVYECALAVDAIGGMVCADGGCTVPGDIAKAFIAGADFVMLGGMLAGTDQSGGQMVLHRKVPKKSVKVKELPNGGSVYKFEKGCYDSLASLPSKAWETLPLEEPKMLFYGMSSDTAMSKYHGGVAEYRSSEGRTVLIPYKGSVHSVIQDILGGIRSSMSYVGVTNLKDAAHSAVFVETTKQLNTVFVK